MNYQKAKDLKDRLARLIKAYEDDMITLHHLREHHDEFVSIANEIKDTHKELSDLAKAWVRKPGCPCCKVT